MTFNVNINFYPPLLIKINRDTSYRYLLTLPIYIPIALKQTLGLLFGIVTLRTVDCIRPVRTSYTFMSIIRSESEVQNVFAISKNIELTPLSNTTGHSGLHSQFG